MFHHVKELPFNARVSGPRFSGLLLEQYSLGDPPATDAVKQPPAASHVSAEGAGYHGGA